MTVTFVTAFFTPKTPYRSLETYLAHFRPFAATGVPILLFLDPDVSVDVPANVRILSRRLDLSWIPEEVQLPAVRTPTKDTREYFAIQLEKLHILADAVAHTETSHLAWLDFGAFHMFCDHARSTDLLQEIAVSSFPSSRILAPGCWPPGLYDWNRVSWRFCGTFLLGHRDLFRPAYEAQTKLVRDQLPRLTWEVNVWAQMEEHFEVYLANHDDTLLSLAMVFVQRHQGVLTCSSVPSDTHPSITDRTAS